MPESSNSPRPLVTGVLLTTFTVVLGLVLIFSGRIPARAAYDQLLYHEPAIRQFMDQWPDFDLWHYKSATTPGYHLLLAAVGKFISASVTALQVASLAIAGGLMFLFGTTVGRYARPVIALAICLPFACSMYVVHSGAFLLPDNFGWLGVLAILTIALRPRLSIPLLLWSGLLLVGLVFVRQIHVWTAGLVWLAAWLSPTLDWREGALLDVRSLFTNPTQRAGQALLALLATLPGIVLVVLFFRFWGGLVPPVFQGIYKGINYSAIVLMLATFGAFSPFFAGFWIQPFRELWRTKRSSLLVVLTAVLLVCLILPTTYDYGAGRRTGLWNVAARLPVIANHASPFMIGLALLGGASILSLLSLNEPRRRVLLIAAIIGYSAACAANPDLFQRYVDPFALMLLAILCAPRSTMAKVPTLVGPVILAMLLLSVSLFPFVSDYQSVTGPPPAAVEDNRILAPSDLPRPPQPPGRHLWPW